ncbi:MAG TPA: di-heme oxidoredictase family protein [Bdellovibrionota bacterium]|jgi:CxxC motif-containing protein (DUF1111 family)|nr:di-heme oxidoredictase family protein [Bdellovibrionota bacterium]
MIKRRIDLLFALLTVTIAASGCQEYETIKAEMQNPKAGGEGTVFASTSDAYSLPMKNITARHRVDFVVGNALFKENWVPSPSSVESRQGLGPLMNAHSCSSCHFKDGRGAPPIESGEVPVALLVRMSLPGKDPQTGGVLPVPNYGDQLQHKAILGVRAEASFLVDYEELPGRYADGTLYTLVKPILKFSDHKFGPWPKQTLLSARIAPPMIGVGLLEAIPETDILALADANDRDGDGISGRPNRVWNHRTQSSELGRFGWKANQPDVHQQTAGAFAGDMGITSHTFTKQNCAPEDTECRGAHATGRAEITEENLMRVVNYSKNLAVPSRRNLSDRDVLSGAGVFHTIGCAKCHVSSHVTGVDPDFPENSGQKIFPYTDLLLHDMGEGLADHRPDFEASGREWRTAPLWGIGLTKTVNGHTRFLHDGRARSLEEAILWHGGEATAARTSFVELSAQRRAELIKFLEAI